MKTYRDETEVSIAALSEHNYISESELYFCNGYNKTWTSTKYNSLLQYDVGI